MKKIVVLFLIALLSTGYLFAGEPITIKEARAKNMAFSLTTKGVVTYSSGTHAFIQDATGGISVSLKSFEMLEDGEEITVTGQKMMTLGLTSATLDARTKGTPLVPDTVEIHNLISELNWDKETYDCQLIRLENVPLDTVYINGSKKWVLADEYRIPGKAFTRYMVVKDFYPDGAYKVGDRIDLTVVPQVESDKSLSVYTNYDRVQRSVPQLLTISQITEFMPMKHYYVKTSGTVLKIEDGVVTVSDGAKSIPVNFKAGEDLSEVKVGKGISIEAIAYYRELEQALLLSVHEGQSLTPQVITLAELYADFGHSARYFNSFVRLENVNFLGVTDTIVHAGLMPVFVQGTDTLANMVGFPLDTYKPGSILNVNFIAGNPFKTQPDWIELVSEPSALPKILKGGKSADGKYIIKGQLYIRKEDAYYNAKGQRVK